jgi:hypothetical protein
MLFVVLAFSTGSVCADSEDLYLGPDQDIWVPLMYKNMNFKRPIIVHIEKESIVCDSENCPAEDTLVMGEDAAIDGTYTGFYSIVIEKGFLNDPEHYLLEKPECLKKNKKFDGFRCRGI